MRLPRLPVVLIAVFAAVDEARCIPVPLSDDGMSRLHVAVEPHRLELRFEFDQKSLSKMKAENSRAVAAFIEDNMHLEINGIAMNPGVMSAEEGGGSHAPSVTFVRDSNETVKTIGVSMEIFDTLGDRHRMEAVFEQEGRKYETFFTVFEPDYLYDTGWSAPQVARRLSWRQGTDSVWRSRALPAGMTLCFLALRFLPIKRRRVALLLGMTGLAALWIMAHAPSSAEPSAWRFGQVVGILVVAAAASPLLFVPRRRA